MSLLQSMENITASSFTHINSPRHNYATQDDGINCGLYVLWYHILHLKEKGYINKESPPLATGSDI